MTNAEQDIKIAQTKQEVFKSIVEYMEIYACRERVRRNHRCARIEVRIPPYLYVGSVKKILQFKKRVI